MLLRSDFRKTFLPLLLLLTGVLLFAIPHVFADANDRYWVGADAGATANWNDANNWSLTSGGAGGANVPGATDDAIFDGGGGKVGGVIIDADVSIASLTATAGYTGANANDGHINNATNNRSIAVSGNVTLDNKQVSMGDATWTVTGNFDNKDVTTFNRNVSTLVMVGTSKTITGTWNRPLNNLTIAGSVTNNGAAVRGNITVNEGATLHSAISSEYHTGIFTNNGTVSGSVKFRDQSVINNGVWTANASADYSLTLSGSSVYGGNWSIKKGWASTSVTFNSDITFTGNVTINADTSVHVFLINNSGNYNLTFQGNVSLIESVGTISWTKGTGTITLSSSNVQTVNFLDKAVEDIVIKKSGGSVQFTDGVTTDSFDLQAGTVDLNGQAITTTGDFATGTGGNVTASGLSGSILTVGGNFSANGSDGDLLTLNASGRWYLNVVGTGTGTYINVAYSDASSGSQITCATGCINGGNNTNWDIPSDSTPPTISTLSPADNALEVAVGTNLVITFSENVSPQPGADNDIVIRLSSDNSIVETIDAQSAQVTGSGTDIITINPSENFVGSTSYYVQIGADAFDDLSGNSFAGISDSTTWNFTTDSSPPLVQTLSPANNAISVAIDSNLVLTFSEAVDPESGNITIKKTSDNSTVETIDVTSGLVTGGGTPTITVNPVSDFDYNTEYYVQIDATAFDDASGNSFAGIADTTSWSFMTIVTAEPWFEDSFEGIPPYGVSSGWDSASVSEKWDIGTTDEQGTPVGGGHYAYRQRWSEEEWFQYTADHVTNTFTTSVSHGYVAGDSVRFEAGEGGIRPTPLSRSYAYEIINETEYTFQVREIGASAVVNLSDDGTSPNFVYLPAVGGALKLDFGDEKLVPIIEHGEDISLSYWLKYHPDFTYGTSPESEGLKYFLLHTTFGDSRMYSVGASTSGRMMLYATTYKGAQNWDANVGETYNMPIGEWVKFDWYLKVGEIRYSVTGDLLPNATDPGIPIASGTYNRQTTDVPVPYWTWTNSTGTFFLWYVGGDSNTWRITKALGTEPDDVVWQKTGSIEPHGEYVPIGAGATGTATVNNLGADGIIKGWVNNQLKWDYANTPTVRSGGFGSFSYYAQYASGPPRGENQKRYIDLFRIGPGAMVLNEFNEVAPTLSSTTPADNATSVSTTANLVLTFSEAVNPESGNITIKKTSDDSTVETIAVTSGQVTGGGTTTITVNPSVTLANSTEYYVLIDATAFDDAAGNSYAGISSTTAWSFTTIAAASSAASSVPTSSSAPVTSSAPPSSALSSAASSVPASSATPASSVAPAQAVTTGGGGGGRRGTADASTLHFAATAAPPTTPVIFRDVPASAWYAPFIAEIVERGIASGYADANGRSIGIFGPARPVSFGEIAKMALEAADKSPQLPSPLPENRRARRHWSMSYIAHAEALKFPAYTPTLNPDDSASRGAVIETLLAAFEIPLEDAPHAFRDLRASHRHAKAIGTAAKLGIIIGDTGRQGEPTGTVRPNDPINRAEVAKIIATMLELLGR